MPDLLTRALTQLCGSGQLCALLSLPPDRWLSLEQPSNSPVNTTSSKALLSHPPQPPLFDALGQNNCFGSSEDVMFLLASDKDEHLPPAQNKEASLSMVDSPRPYSCFLQGLHSVLTRASTHPGYSVTSVPDSD